MPTLGYLRIRAYTSRAQFPLEDVAVTVVSDTGQLLALRLTDSSGMAGPISLEVPARSDSQTPTTGPKPFTTVNIYARAEGYDQILVRGIQIFADTTTMQDLAMVPLSELPGTWNHAEVFDTPPQNL